MIGWATEKPAQNATTFGLLKQTSNVSITFVYTIQPKQLTDSCLRMLSRNSRRHFDIEYITHFSFKSSRNNSSKVQTHLSLPRQAKRRNHSPVNPLYDFL